MRLPTFLSSVVASRFAPSLVAAAAGMRVRAPLCTAAATLATLEIDQFKCLSDNYGFLVHDPASGCTAAIDTPEVGPIVAALERRGWTLTHILNTHHHADHSGGNAELKRMTG